MSHGLSHESPSRRASFARAPDASRLGEDEDAVAVHVHKLLPENERWWRHCRTRPADGGSLSRASPVESKDEAQGPKIECMKRIST